jgi:NAD(P)-dependent dehydrogenase (short-subunit alcohol dehydrogenase family)
MTPFSLAGRTALVTGASGALGAHFARVLADAGAAVVLAARRPDAVRDAAAALGGRAVALDVTDEASVKRAFDEAGAPDVVVNNAGIARTRPVLDQDAADWDAVANVDLRGAFLVAAEAGRRLVAAGRGGAIVNVASIVGLRAMPGLAAYAAAKAGLLHLTRQMAVELARHRIRVNALAPGYIETDMNRDFFGTEAGQAMIRRIPQRRLGRVDDLTGPLLLLASDAGAGMTGAVVTVDGGHSVNGL